MAAGAVLLWMSLLSGYDIAQRRLPNWLTLPGAALILLGAVPAGREWPALAGAAALGTVYLLVHLAAPTAMGAGDVKLALGLGALTGCFGADVWLLAAIGAPLLTAVVAVVAVLRGGRHVPHGPSMCLASAMAVALGCLSTQPAQKPQQSLELRMFVVPASQRQSARLDAEHPYARPVVAHSRAPIPSDRYRNWRDWRGDSVRSQQFIVGSPRQTSVCRWEAGTLSRSTLR
jgi:leader peptidase (prepilin peptidase) / N-methyltransferase